MRKFVVVFFAIWSTLLFTSCHSGSNTGIEGNTNTLVITDIHFDPFNSCGESFGNPVVQNCVAQLINESDAAKWYFPILAKNKFNEETNQAFLESALNNLAVTIKSQNIKNIFVTGDLLSHKFPKQFAQYVPGGTQAQHTQLALNTINYVLYKISRAVPGVEMYYIFGNNDTDMGDYALPTESFMTQVTPLIKKYMVNPEDFSKTFSLGGFSKIPYNENVDVIGLNFNPLTAENDGVPLDEVAAITQYGWLESQLKNARSENKKVIILQHEPFGINVYNIIESYPPYVILESGLQESYINLYKKYNDVITNFYYGHYHMENFTVVNEIFSFSTLGFSVDFDNNPGFKVLNISPSGELQNFTTYYNKYSEGKKLTWEVMYNLNEDYGIYPSQHTTYFESVLQLGDNKNWLNYAFNFSGRNLLVTESNMPINNHSNWKYYYCSISNYTLPNFNNCLSNH